MGEDAYGIPDNMFGHVPEIFFGRLGRVVMVASMLELRLLDLLTELDQAPQDKHAGTPAAGLIAACRVLLDRYDPAFAESATGTLEKAQQALNDRNAVVHSLWPDPDTDSAYGWRPVRKNRRDSPDQPYASITLNGWQLRDLIASTAALVHHVDRLRERAAPARLPAL